MVTKFKISGGLLLAACVICIGCADDKKEVVKHDGSVADMPVARTDGTVAGDMASTAGTLTLTLSGLGPLSGGFMYEGWAIVDGAPVSTGKFNLDAGGKFVDASGSEIVGGKFVADGIAAATAIVISIEPKDDADPAPSKTKVLAGALTAGTAAMTLGADAALGDTFETAAGSYILATPTNGAATDENSGVWFLKPEATPIAGLTLPTLPEGWKYEGWAVIEGTPVTTGTFTDPAKADEASPYSGATAGPGFPGEDFLVNAPSGVSAFPVDLSGATIVVSVEPDPDDSPLPFAIKPLVGAVPAAAADHTAYDMDNKAAGLPSGTATLE